MFNNQIKIKTIKKEKPGTDKISELAKKDQHRFTLFSHRADLSTVRVIDTYAVNGVNVYITSTGEYLAVEPPLTPEAHDIYKQMMQQLYYSLEPMQKTTDPVNYIEQHMWNEAQESALTKVYSANFSNLRYYLVRDILGYGILDVLMNDDLIEEITIEKFDMSVGVVHRKHNEFNILDTNITFQTSQNLNHYIVKTIQKTGNTITAAMPIASAMTKEGHRITATYGNEVTTYGPTLNIRKFTKEPFTIVHLLRYGALNKIMAAYFWMITDAKGFGLVVGETGSGKTTLLNALMGLSNPRIKVITIEETPELRLPHKRWQAMKTRTGVMLSQHDADIDIMTLNKASLRMRPDFVIVGEVRGEEAQYMFQSAATGHGGLTTFHGSGAESALNRLASSPINIKASQQMLLWYIGHVTRLRTPDKKVTRKIISIKEVIPKTDSVELHEVFRYDQKTQKFNISTIAELVSKSKKIHAAADVLNVDPSEDLQNRLDLLEQCLAENATTNEKVFSIISKLYL